MRVSGRVCVQPLRATDVSEELARERYRVFKKNVYEALRAIKGHFHFHFIPAEGPPDEVRNRINEEFVYQSSLELGNDTYQLVSLAVAVAVVLLHGEGSWLCLVASAAGPHV